MNKKQILTGFLAVTIFAACQQGTANQDKAKDGKSISAGAKVPAAPDAAILTFEKESYDFGKIKQGEKVHYDFKFRNTGKTPLIISNATATCGCTIPEIPKAPVKPGDEGIIKVVFNSTGKMGIQDKVITVTSNANPEINEVHLKGEVTEP